MRPNTNPASAERLRAYAQQLRDVADNTAEAISRDSLLKLAGEFDDLALEKDEPRSAAAR